MYTLQIIEKGNVKLDIQGHDFDVLKNVARKYNRRGYDVRIVQHTKVFEVIQSEKK